MPKYEIQFSPDDKMDTRAYQIMEKAFGIDLSKILFTSHEMPIELFLTFNHSIDQLNQPIFGHKVIHFDEVPEDDKPLYKENELSPEQNRFSGVWYPPMSERRERYICMRNRIKAIRKVEQAFKINLKELKDIDKHPEVKLYDVAKAVDDFELNKLRDGDSYKSTQ